MKRVICAGAYPALQRTLAPATFVPGTVNRISTVQQSVAGKAVNAARVLRRLGADPVVAGFSGGASGVEIAALLAAEGLDCTGLLQVGAPVRICQTILPGDGSAFTELIEEGPMLPDEDWLALIEQCRGCIVQGREAAMILAGTMPPHASLAFYPALIQAAAGPVLLDTSGPALQVSLPARPDLVKINADELRATCSAKGRTDVDIVRLARLLLEAGARAVGITQGSGHAFLVTAENAWAFTIPSVKLVSALGSGDSVNAGTVFGLLAGRTLVDAFVLGLACGTANAETAQPGDVDLHRVQTLALEIGYSLLDIETSLPGLPR